VSWFSSLLHEANPLHLASDASHAVGTVVADGAHAVGGLLTEAGLSGAANAVDEAGDDVASALGASVPEAQLWQTTNPAELIHGDPSALRQAADRLTAFAGAFGETANGLQSMDTGHWTGAAADAFRSKFSPEPEKWQNAATACRKTAGALTTFAAVVESAQKKARQAITLYQQGNHDTAAAQAAYDASMADYQQNSRLYRARQAGGQEAGPAPVAPGAFVDTGAPLRTQAQLILAAARTDRDEAGSAAAKMVNAAASLAPKQPDFWSQLGDDSRDLVEADLLGTASLLSGVVSGTADLLKFARSLNPFDYWNVTHLAEYAEGVSATGAGLVHDVIHPGDLVTGTLGTPQDWETDPFQQLGRLLPNAALALATDGGGTAAEAGAGAGDAAAMAEAGTADAAGDAAAQAARESDAVPKIGEPVDVATGDVLLDQTDVVLPGVLSLVVQRSHRSSYRGGRWFGRSWASTLDQRLVVAGRLVAFALADGAVLCYPRPGDSSDGPVLPVAGEPWPLARDSGGYTVTDPQAGLSWRFEPRPGFALGADGEGELPLVTVADRAGHRIVFGYTEDGTPETITHDGGYQVKIAAARSRVTGLALAGAGSDGGDAPLLGYRYDEAGDLAEVINSSGAPLRLHYDEAGRLAEWEDRNGCSYRYTYDDSGRCVRGEGPEGALSGTFTYGSDNLVTTHTDATGAATVYQFTARGPVAAGTDPLGNVTRLEHDERGRLVSRTDPLGRVSRWSYDDAGNLTTVTRPDGLRATATYSQLNLPVLVRLPSGAAWLQEYDTVGNLVRVTGPDGAVTRYSWDERGHVASVTDALGTVTVVTCDAAGLVVGVTSPDGQTARTERDGFGRPTAVTDPGGDVTRLAWTTEGQLAVRILPDGTAERFGYDGEGNLVAHLGPVAAADAVTSSEADSGRITLGISPGMTGVARFEYGSFDTLVARTGPDGRRADFGYDPELRLTSVTMAGGDFGAPRGRTALTWRYEYDAAGRLVAETDFNGAVTRYAYDAAGQLVTLDGAAGQHQSFSYDLVGNVTERHAGDVVTTFGYDPAGRLEWAVGPGAVIEIQRDAAGRVTGETCNGRTVRSVYNAAGQRVARVTPSGAVTRWDYDPAGRVAALSAGRAELRFGYDETGRETLRELPGGARLAQEWDAAGRLATQVVTAGRAAAGSVVAQPDRGAGIGPPGADGPAVLQRRGYRYRADGALCALDDMLCGPRRLTLDAVGRVTRLSGPDWAESYAYDLAGNVIAAGWPTPPGPAAAWTGAAAQGHRQYSGTVITRAGGISYRHDASGRITARQRARISRKPATWRYHWDADDQLTSVTTPDGTTWRYSYDPLGRRIAKQRLDVNGVTAEQTDFIWDGPVLAEQVTLSDLGPGPARPAGGSDGGPAVGHIITWDYEPGTFVPLAQTERWRRAAQDEVDSRFYAIVTDLVGAPAELTGDDGSLAGYQQRTLWGTTVWHPGGATTPLRFPGQYADDETGLHYNNQRYYDPATGRYLTPDPMGLAADPNPHAYVANPTVLTDPLGLFACQQIPPPDQITSMKGPVYAWAPRAATPELAARYEAEVKAYVDGSNRALKDGYLNSTGRTSTAGDLRAAASRDAARVRAAARKAGDTSYEGMHVGHVPDTTWSGKPQGYEYMPLTPKVNMSLGYWSQAYPEGYIPTKFVYVPYRMRFGYLYGRLYGTG
jgi:RHS repeat-associated protein